MEERTEEKRKENPPLFRPEAMQSLTSPEQLGSYIRAARPKTWLIVIVLCLIMTAVVIWSFFGVIIVQISANAIQVHDNTCASYLTWEDMIDVDLNMTVVSDFSKGRVKQIETKSQAYETVMEEIGVYTVERLKLTQPNRYYRVLIEMEDVELEALAFPVTIVVQEIHPIELIFGQKT